MYELLARWHDPAELAMLLDVNLGAAAAMLIWALPQTETPDPRLILLTYSLFYVAMAALHVLLLVALGTTPAVEWMRRAYPSDSAVFDRAGLARSGAVYLAMFAAIGLLTFGALR